MIRILIRKNKTRWKELKKEWLFDGKECPKAPDDEFRMMSPTSLADVNAQHEGEIFKEPISHD